MNIVNRLLYRITGHLRLKVISDKGRPYLERYYLFTLLGVRFYLHRFVGSDPDRGLHDHPWPWAASIVLSGWYLEETRGFEQHAITRALAELHGTTGVVRRKVRWFNNLTGDSFHRVVLPTRPVRLVRDGKYIEQIAEPCWTLFFHRAHYGKEWGFLRKVEDHDCYIYVPHRPKGDSEPWWNRNPIGNLHSERVPLDGVST